MAAKNTTVSIGIVLNGKQASMQIEAMQEKVDRLTESLAKMRIKLADKSQWGKDETEATIKADIKQAEKDLKTAKQVYKNVVSTIRGIEEVLKDISHSNYNELTRTKGLILSAIKSLDPLSDEYEKKIRQLQELQDEIAKRSIDVRGSMTEQKASDVMANLKDYSATEIEDAIKVMERLRDMQKVGENEWKKYAAQIAEANKELDKFRGQNKIDAMAGQLSNIGSLSKSALAEQKKFWQAAVDGAAQGSSELTQYEANLKKVNELQKALVSQEGKGLVDSVLTDSWSGTISEAKEAVKTLKEYKDTLDTTDTDNIQAVERAMAELNNKTKLAEVGFKSTKEALNTLLRQTKNLGSGTFTGSLSELEEIRRKLITIRDTQEKILSPSERDDLLKAIRNVDNELDVLKGNAVDINHVLENLKDTPLSVLEKAAAQLKEEINNCAESSEDFVEKSAKLREVNAQVDKLKKQFKDHGNVVEKTAKRLMAYVAVYGGFNELMGRLKELTQLNLQLSDSLADVQKTTGLTGVELHELGRGLESIDTRTATTELYNLAAAAGQIGLKTQEDVLGFAKAANVISVALNELGAEGSATITKIATLTGDVANSGTEQALLKVGSAINELTANSAATAGPIADFISRIGGIASASGIAIHEMAALGAATDASAQSVEIAGTSMNKFISALLSNTDNIAYAANLNAKELKGLIDQGNTMQAVIRVLESMQDMSRGSASAVLKELGSEGARMNQYVASLVANLDLLKRQLSISREAFDENVSVLNEYNVKQESAMGILQRMKNAFMDTFVNSKMTVVLKDILERIAAIPGWLEKHRTILLAIKIAIAQILVLKLPMLLNALMMQLSGLYKLLAGPFIAAMTSFKNAWITASLQVVASGKSINGLTGALRVLWTVIKANPIGLLVTAVTAAVVAWHHFNQETDVAIKATAELSDKHARQLDELKALRNALEASNTSYAVRAAAMREINSLYSKYLGFELSELDTYDKKKAALDYINAKLKENQTLELATTQKEAYSSAFSEEAKKDLEGLTQGLMEIPEIGAKRLTEAMNIIQQAVKDGATTTEQVIDKLEEHFKAKIKVDDTENPYTKAFGGAIGLIINAFDDTALESLDKYIEKYSLLQQQLQGTDEYFSQAKLDAQRASSEALYQLQQAQANRILGLEQEEYKDSESAQIAHLQQLLKENEEYQATVKRLREQSAAEDKEYLTSIIDRETQQIDEQKIRERYENAVNLDSILERIAQMNEVQEQMATMRQARADADMKMEEAQAQLELELQKENNEAQVAEARKNLEALKHDRDFFNVEIIQAEMEWNDQYLKLQTEATSETSALWSKTLGEVGDKIQSLKFQIAGDPWGKALNLKDWKQFPALINGIEDASVTSLASAFKKLSENTKLITGDVAKFNEMFELKTPLNTLEEVNIQVFDWLNQIRRELKKRNRGVTGEVLWGNAKEEMDFVLNQIKTYFLQQQSAIRQSYLDGMITHEEMKRRLDGNNKELLNAQIQFRKMMLGQQSTFTELMIPGLEDHDLFKLRTEIRILGDEVTDEIEKSLAEDENVVTEGAMKIRQAIERELLEGDPFEVLRQGLRGSLDELKLMSSEFERELIAQMKKLNPEVTEEELGGLTEENMQARLDFLTELAKKSYTVDRDGLRKMFDSHAQYYAWVDKLDDEQLELMLIKLQKFYDDSLLASKNYADRANKALESSYEQQGLKYDDIAKLEWKIQESRAKRSALQSEQGAAMLDAMGDEHKQAQAMKVNAEEIQAYTQLINRYEEQLLEAREKAAKKRKEGRSKQERQAREDAEASLSALQAYYNEQETLINKKALENDWTQATLDRELRKNMIARERDMIELRKKLVGDASKFDPTKNEGYKGAITGTVFFGENRTEEELQRQADQVKRWGEAMQDGMRNAIAKSGITIEEALVKQKQKIDKLLLEDDFSEKVVNQYIETLDELGLLFNIETEAQAEMSREQGEARLAYMREWAKESYNLTAETLENEMRQNELFNAWVEGRDAEHYEALLVQLRKFHDDQIEADKKAADRRKKILESSDTGRALTQQNEANIREEEKDVEMWDRFKGMGLASDDAVDKAQIDMYQAKIDASNAWIHQIDAQIAAEKAQLEWEMQKMQMQISLAKMRGEDTSELEAQFLAMQQQYISLSNQQELMGLQHKQDIADAEKEIENRRISMQQNMVGEVKKYTDALTQFAYDAAYAEEDADATIAEARNAMIKSLLTSLKDWAQMKLTELILNAMFGSQRLAQEGQETSASLGMKSAEASGEVTAATIKATAREVGSKGLVGLAVGAVIGAALNALLGAAMAKLDKKQAEIKNKSGVGRLATGMLTYAEGNYPVLGNDGKVYDAKYEGAGMKTGIYRGGAHFGIFSEKKPEAIIDGDTTQRLILNHPDIWKAIVTLSKNGRLDSGMGVRTFARGNVHDFGGQVAEVPGGVAVPSVEMQQMQAALENNSRVMAQLSQLLAGGIHAKVDMYGSGGVYESMQKADRFMGRRRG